MDWLTNQPMRTPSARACSKISCTSSSTSNEVTRRCAAFVAVSLMTVLRILHVIHVASEKERKSFGRHFPGVRYLERMDETAPKKRRVTSVELAPDVLLLLEKLEASEAITKGALINEALRRHGLEIARERVKKMADAVASIGAETPEHEVRIDSASYAKPRAKRQP